MNDSKSLKIGVLLGFFLGLFAFSGIAQGLEPTLTHDHIKGRVVNEKMKGVPGVIEFYDPSTDKLVEKAKIDEEGKFEILLPKFSRVFFIIKQGYFTYFFKDKSHVMETSTEKIKSTISLEFAINQYSEGTEIILDNLNFATNKSEVTAGHEPILKFLAEFLKKHPGIEIQVAGHTDNVGNEEENDILSSERAKSVMSHLVDEHGIDQDRVSYYGYGESRPLTSNETSEGKAINRRTSFIITKGI